MNVQQVPRMDHFDETDKKRMPWLKDFPWSLERQQSTNTWSIGNGNYEKKTFRGHSIRDGKLTNTGKPTFNNAADGK